MSFVITTPEMVAAAAGNLADVGTTLGQAFAVTAGPTTEVATGAADDVSVAISQLFSRYGQEFQALGAQAAVFHDDFVRLLNGGAAAYLSTEIANAQQGLANSVNTLAPTGAGAAAPQASGPWQMLYANTAANVQTTVSNWAADPFPVVKQVIVNQNGYANTVGTGLASALQNFPVTVANIPANVQLGIQGVSNFNYGAFAQSFINSQIGYGQAINTALQNAATDLPTRLPVTGTDITSVYQAVVTGDYHGAVYGVPRTSLDLFLSGINISDLSNVQVAGPAGDLLPVSSVFAQEEQEFVSLLAPGSIPAQIAQNFVNGTNAGAESLGLAVIGPPIATLDGFATGATALGSALQTGNGVGAVGALVDMPAYALNGFLNGDTIVDLTVPVTETATIPAIPPLLFPTTVGAGTPVVIHMPFEGILVQPQPITATMEVPSGGGTVPVTFTVGGVQVGGVVPTLLNYIPQQIAAAISPK